MIEHMPEKNLDQEELDMVAIVSLNGERRGQETMTKKQKEGIESKEEVATQEEIIATAMMKIDG